MEPLAYLEIATTYEESVGPIAIRSIVVPRHLNFKKLWGLVAILSAIAFGGFTAAVSTGFSSPETIPAPQQSLSGN